MFKWIIWDDFTPMCSSFRTGNDHLDKAVEEARKMLHGWTDDEVKAAIDMVDQQCEQYVKFKTEELKDEIAGRIDADYGCTDFDPTFEFIAVDEYRDWPLELDPDELTVIDVLGEEDILEFMLNYEKNSLDEWSPDDKFQSYSKIHLLACFTLRSIEAYNFSLKYPDHCFFSEIVTYNQATDEQRIRGLKDAVTHAVRAMKLLASALLEKNKEDTIISFNNASPHSVIDSIEEDPFEGMVLNISPKKSQINRSKIGRNAAKARIAKRYEPMQKFIFDQYHKGSYQSVPEAAKALAEPLRDFCKKEDIGYLSPARDKRTTWMLIYLPLTLVKL